MRNGKRFLSLLMALFMLLSLFPASALAEEPEGTIAPVSEPAPEPDEPAGDGTPDVPPDEPAAEPMPDEPQDDEYYFLVQPTGGSYDPETYECLVGWELSFVPELVVIEEQGVWGEWNKYQSFTGLHECWGYYPFPMNGYSSTYRIVAYAGDHCVQSRDFSICADLFVFNSIPASGSYDLETYKYTATWETSFIPRKVVIEKKGIWGEWNEYQSFTNLDTCWGFYNFPMDGYSSTYRIKAYADGYSVTTDDFTIYADLFKFTLQPKSGYYDPTNYQYTATWETSFIPRKIVIEKKGIWGEWNEYQSFTNLDACWGFYNFPMDGYSSTYRIKAYADGCSVTSTDFSIYADLFTFSTQPESGSFDPDSLEYTAVWTTSFIPRRVVIEQQDIYGDWVEFDSFEDISTWWGFYTFHANNSNNTYRIVAAADGWSVTSGVFYISTDLLCFVTQPYGSAYDPATNEYTVSWKTSFVPLRIQIEQKTMTGWTTYDTLTEDMAKEKSCRFPPHSSSSTYRLRAVFTEGNSKVSEEFYVNANAPTNYGSCGATEDDDLFWYYENGTLTVSGSGSMKDYSLYTIPWRYFQNEIRTVAVEDGVSSVGAYAFYHCSALTTVNLPSTLESIGNYAFDGCPALADANINMSRKAFQTKVIWDAAKNSGLNDAEKHFTCFADGQAGPNLTWQLSDDGVLRFYGSGAMYDWTRESPAPWYAYRSRITNVSLSNVSSVGNYAFYNCTNLTHITILSTVNALGAHAFSGCTGMTSVKWTIQGNERITEIPEVCFSGCTSLQSFTVPKNCTVIGQGAFSGCDALTTVSFPAGSALTTVGKRAFYSCDNLASIPLPEGVTGLGDEAFYNCRSLESLPLPSTLTSLGAYCFSGCSAAAGTVTIPAGITEIPERCFLGCSGFYELALMPKVTEIGPYAFSGCSKLTHVDYDGFRAQWEDVTVGSSNTPLTNAGFSWLFRSGKISGTEVCWRIYGGPGELEIYGSGNMKDWETTPENAPWYLYRLYIETIDIHPSVESVGINAFRMCKNLKTVYLPDTLKKIGSTAFHDCTNLTDVWYNGSELMRQDKLTIDGYNNPLLRAQWHYADIGGSVTGPEGGVDLSWSFDPDSGILRVYWSDDNMDQNYLEIPDYVDGQDTPWYQYNHGQLVPLIKAVQVDELVTRIGDYAFAGLDELTEVQIASTVTGIGEGAFKGCRNLISITIPDTVETLGDNLFWYCGSLDTVTLPAGLTEIPSGTFYACVDLTTVYIPGTVERIGKNAFSGCEYLTDICFGGSSVQWCAIELYSGNDPVNSAAIHFTPPEIAVDEANFPDAKFRAWVAEYIDTDRSGWLTDEERLAATGISCPNLGIASLTGIAFFPNITYLDARNNRICGAVDLTGNSKLVSVNLSVNELNSLNLTGLTALKTLMLNDNDSGWAAPDLSTNIALEYLDCRNCDGMEGLDLSANTALISLDCSCNQLDALDLSQNTALEQLSCGRNNLTALDLSANTELRQVACDNNVLTTLTLGQQSRLFTLACHGNSLARLDLTGCPRLLAAVLEGTVTETDSDVKYSKGGDYVQADKSTVLITAHYSLLGLQASAAGVVQNTAGKYVLDSIQRTPLWQGGNAPGFSALSNSSSVICSDEATVRPITTEPVPGGVYYLYLGLSPTAQGQGAVELAGLSAADCSLSLPGYTCECISVTIGVTSGGYDKATILFRITKDAPEGIPIDGTHFPDPNFRAYVAENHDPDGNGWLTDGERKDVGSVDAGAREIASLQGIEFFPELTSLDAEMNDLTELDLSANPKLTHIGVSYNDLTELDLSGLKLLAYLEADGNDLSALELSDNTELETLYCSENRILTLDVSMLPKLEILGCGDNQLDTLDLHANTALTFLDCSSNALTGLDLSANTALRTLYVIANPMPSLDVSMLPELRVLECYDMPLETLTLGRLPKLSRFACYWMSADLLLDFTGCPILVDAYKNGSRRIITITEELSFAEYKNAPLSGVLELDVDPPVLGDLNGDGTISALDLLQLRKALVGLPTEGALRFSDLNRDGAANILDLVRLRKLLAA